MPITLNRALAHEKDWSVALKPFPSRAHWPLSLFHSCQIEVAVEIIKSGQITCRSNVKTLICDVANQGAVWNNPDAHDYVRLYFRPRNSFHLKTEGVKTTQNPHRAQNHMSMPVAFAFAFEKVMILPGTGFVFGNFAKTGAAPVTGDMEFDKLPFDLIYHDSAPPSGKMAEIHNWRMSEVVVPQSLSLDHLRCVFCRTIHEERTLRYLLGNITVPEIVVEQRSSIFLRRGIFLDEIYLSDGILNLKFHGPIDFPKEAYDLRIICSDGKGIRDKYYIAKAGIRYHFPDIPGFADAVWRVELEGCMVYYAPVPHASGVVASI